MLEYRYLVGANIHKHSITIKIVRCSRQKSQERLKTELPSEPVIDIINSETVGKRECKRISVSVKCILNLLIIDNDGR